MSNSQIVKGGLAVPAPSRVATDQVTIFGDGSAESPLSGGGVGGVVVHDNTLIGHGTSGDPLGVDTAEIATLLAGEVAVAVDGSTIGGNGTTGSPLHTIGGGTTVATDVTLTGNGSSGDPLSVDITQIAGDLDGKVGVATDATLTGNGTTGDPLHVVSSGATPGVFKATFVGFGSPIPGKAVVVSTATLDPGTNQAVTPGNPLNATPVVGVIEAVNLDGSVQVRTLGEVTLSQAQWNAARGGGSGGLATAEPFYLSASGLIDDVAPTDLGSYTQQVGIALNPTTMALSCPTSPNGPHPASALVKSNAYVTSKGFSGGLGHSATGRYQLTLAGTPPPDNNCIPVVTLATNFSVAVSVSVTVASGVVDVFISSEPGGAGIDGDFYVSVTSNA